MGAELWFGIRQRSEMGIAVFAQHVKVPTATERYTEKPPTWQRYTHLPQRKKVEEQKLLIICTFLAPLILQMGRGESINIASQTGDACQTGHEEAMLTKL